MKTTIVQRIFNLQQFSKKFTNQHEKLVENKEKCAKLLLGLLLLILVFGCSNNNHFIINAYFIINIARFDLILLMFIIKLETAHVFSIYVCFIYTNTIAKMAEKNKPTPKINS